jgi:hypothetical protein
MLSNFRSFFINKTISSTGRITKYKSKANQTSNATFDQYAAHSPMQMSRHGTEELRSKIFFEHPPIPNRIPKFFVLFCIAATFGTGIRDKIRRRNKRYVRDQERKLFRVILPFVQAMEDLRYTALEMKNYMVIKSISDALNPSYFEHIRWRFHQEDILYIFY